MTGSPIHEASSAIVAEDGHGVRTITLNRPAQLNAITLTMIEQLEAAIASAQHEDDIHVLLIRGAGRSFCAGDDVLAQSEICEAGEQALRDQLCRLQNISSLLTLGNKIAVAEVRGWAIGAGFSWALNCDFRVWGSEACAFFPEVGFGTFVTGGATYLLPRLIGSQAGADALLLGTRLRPTQAQAAALVHATHAEDELSEHATKLARKLAALPSPAAQLMKLSLTSGFASEFRAALSEEIEACVRTTLNPATLARMRAALEKG